MKHIYFVIRIIIISVFLINSFFNQNIYGQKTFNFGAKAGLNLADLFGDTYSGSTFKPGLAIGVLAEMPFSDKWSFAAEIYYSAEGAKAYNKTSSNGNYTYSLTQRINYINLPLVAKFHINQRWNVQAGPQFGFLYAPKKFARQKVVILMTTLMKVPKMSIAGFVLFTLACLLGVNMK